MDLQYGRHGHKLIHVGDVLQQGELIALYLLEGAFVKEIGIGFYVHQCCCRCNLSVQIEELIAAEAFASFVGLGVGEGDPDLVDFVGREILCDVIDMGSQESNIVEVFGDRGFGTRPHAVALDIHANVVDVGVEAGQSHGIIAFAAGELNHDGVVVAKDGLPVSFGGFGILDVVRVGEGGILREFDEFGFAHGVQRYCDLAICRKNINFVLCRQFLKNRGSVGWQI